MISTRIYLFGDPRIERNGTPVNIGRRKALALLAYLAVNQQPYTRSAIAALFWPEMDSRAARSNLRRLLFMLRQDLEGEPLLADGDHIALHPDFELWTDIAEFQSILAQVDRHRDANHPQVLCSNCTALLTRAVSLYSQDFMAGFSLPDSNAFEEWQFFQVENLKARLAQVLQELVAYHQQAGEFETGIEFARRWLALDSLHEPAHQVLMRLYALAGQASAALRQYQELQRLLDQEIGVEPEMETTSLYEAIRSRKFPGSPASLEPLPETGTAASAAAAVYSTLPKAPPRFAPAIPSPLAAGLPVRLPTFSTPFIGRQRERSIIARLLQPSQPARLVTLLGPGGVGKTRLAVESAAAVQKAFPGGIYFIPLAPLETADFIVESLAQELQFSFHEAADHERQVLDYLAPQECVLIFDNFEHILPGANFIQRILETAPGVKVLVTSRERLNLSGESLFHVTGLQYPVDRPFSRLPLTPLELPDHSLATTRPFSVSLPTQIKINGSEDNQDYDAIQLLLDAARRLRPQMEIGAAEIAAAVQICRSVEGLPLAILLAAGWLELLTLEEIAAEIEHNLDFLESQAGDIPDRQRSLRAVFDASWERLNRQEQSILQALSIFHGSFTRDAAHKAAGASLSTLLALMQKSWLQHDETGRYHIHELLRQYASAHLQTDAQDWRQACEKHAAYFASLIEQQLPGIRGQGYDQAFNLITQEWENIRAAWVHFSQEGRFDLLVGQMLPALFRYAEWRWRSQDLISMLEVALEEAKLPGRDIDTCLLAPLLISRASFFRTGESIRYNRYDIMVTIDPQQFTEPWEIVQMLPSPGMLGEWEVQLGAVYARCIDREAGRIYLEHLVEVFQKEERTWELAFALQMHGWANMVESMWAADKQPLLEHAGQHLRESLDLFRQLGDELSSMTSLYWLGNYHYHSQHWDEAIQTWEAARVQMQSASWAAAAEIDDLLGDLYQHIGEFETAFQYYQVLSENLLQKGHPRLAAYYLSKDSYLTLRHGSPETARQLRERSLALSRSVQDLLGECWSVWELADLLRATGDLEGAGRFYEQSLILFTRYGESNGLIFYHRGLGDLAIARADWQTGYDQMKKSLDLAWQAGYKWGASYALARLALICTRLKRLEEAWEYLVQGQETVPTTGEVGLALVVLLSQAEYRIAQEEFEEGAALLAFICDHPFTWNEIRSHAQDRLVELVRRLPAEAFSRAQAKSRTLDAWALAGTPIQPVSQASQS